MMKDYITMFRSLALSFPGTEERPHFDRQAFKVTGKNIFATFHEKTQTANLVLPPEEQKAYCSFDTKNIYPVPNKFGLKGWTTFELKDISADLLSDALYQAYKNVASKK